MEKSICEKCRWNKVYYHGFGSNWGITSNQCLLGGCDESQFEPKDGQMEEAEK